MIERKGHHIAIESLRLLPTDVTLLIAGEGPEKAPLEQLAVQQDVQNRVRFIGVVDQPELKWWYSAADALTLCSSREGWANVLLEAMACGTPVIATDIWGTPEVVSSPKAGVLMQERSAVGLAAAFTKLFANYPARSLTREHAQAFSWEATTQAQLGLFRRIVGNQSVAKTKLLATGE